MEPKLTLYERYVSNDNSTCLTKQNYRSRTRKGTISIGKPNTREPVDPNCSAGNVIKVLSFFF